MINPYKSYKTKQIATIVKLDTLDAYIPYVTIQTEDGGVYEGSIKCVYSRPQLLKVGDKVRFEVQFSITGDRFMVSKLTRIR